MRYKSQIYLKSYELGSRAIKEFIKKCFELKGVRILFWIALLFFTVDCLGVIFASIDAVFLAEYSGYDIAHPFSIILKALELTWHEEASDKRKRYFWRYGVVSILRDGNFAFNHLLLYIFQNKGFYSAG